MREFEEWLVYSLPNGWYLSHLVWLDHCWQVQIADDEHVVNATGGSITEAVHNCTNKALREEYSGRFSVSKIMATEQPDILSLLALPSTLQKPLRRI